MKVNYLFAATFLGFALASCKTGDRQIEKEYSKNLSIAFVDGFKTLSLCKCIAYAHNRELKLWEEDVDCRTPDYLYSQSEVIDSLARQEAEKIKQAEATRDYHRAEGMEGKKIMTSCLSFYNSKELNTIARQKFADQK